MFSSITTVVDFSHVSRKTRNLHSKVAFTRSTLRMSQILKAIEITWRTPRVQLSRASGLRDSKA